MFCPKCGSLLKIENELSVCSCGYSTKTKGKFTETLDREKVDVVPVSDVNPLATEHHLCSKCGFDKAILLPPPAATRETWNSGEGDRSSFICGKCGFKEFFS